jgi:hypothetical protein
VRLTPRPLAGGRLTVRVPVSQSDTKRRWRPAWRSARRNQGPYGARNGVRPPAVPYRPGRSSRAPSAVARSRRHRGAGVWGLLLRIV